MNKLWTTVAIIIILLVFIGYMVFDLVFKTDIPEPELKPKTDTVIADQWYQEKVHVTDKGKLLAVAALKDGRLILAGDSFVECLSAELTPQWVSKTESAVTAVAASSTRIYAAVANTIQVFDLGGKLVADWGPYEQKCYITSVSANDSYVAFADMVSKTVFVMDTGGEVKYFVGRTGEPFVIPSPYFDVALDTDNILYVVNTGKFRMERRTIEGNIIDSFGEPGLAPEYFCGCCNPSHFTLTRNGYVTAEKGLNRIKLLDKNGRFIEFVSSKNNFLPPEPLDLAVSADGTTIFGAYPAKSELYVFKRK